MRTCIASVAASSPDMTGEVVKKNRVQVAFSDTNATKVDLYTILKRDAKWHKPLNRRFFYLPREGPPKTVDKSTFAAFRAGKCDLYTVF